MALGLYPVGDASISAIVHPTSRSFVFSYAILTANLDPRLELMTSAIKKFVFAVQINISVLGE